MKKKTKYILYPGIVILLVLIGVVFYYSTQQSVITFRTYENTAIVPLRTGTFNFAGYSGNYETPYLGSASCRGTSSTFICPNADESASFSNSLQDGNTLILTSSGAGENAFENYITTKVILPAGTLTIDYEYSIFSGAGSNADPFVRFKVYSDDKKFQSNYGRDITTSGSETFKIIIDEEKEVEMSVFVGTGSFDSSSVSGTMSITFEKYPEPIIENVVTEEEPNIIVDIFTDEVIVDEQPVLKQNYKWIYVLIFLIIIAFITYLKVMKNRR